MNASVYPSILLAIIATVIVADPAQATDEPEPPVSVPPADLPIGFDWASHPNATHLTANALSLTSVVDASTVSTANIDLEITGLMPWRSYDLQGALSERAVYADGQGAGVAWAVPATAGSWTLLDRVSGEPVTVFTIQGPNVGPSPEIWCSWCYSYEAESPQPEFSDPAEFGMVTEDAAYSFTDLVSVKTEMCASHKLTVEVKASAGAAASSEVGAKLTYNGNQCLNLHSRGTPVVALREVRFQRDWYSDGSWKIHPTGYTHLWYISNVNVHWEPTEKGEVFKFGPITETQSFSRYESSAGAVYYKNGAQVFGTGVSFTVTPESGTSQQVTIQFHPPGEATFKVFFYAGSGDRGMIAAAWRIE